MLKHNARETVLIGQFGMKYPANHRGSLELFKLIFIAQRERLSNNLYRVLAFSGVFFSVCFSNEKIARHFFFFWHTGFCTVWGQAEMQLNKKRPYVSWGEACNVLYQHSLT